MKRASVSYIVMLVAFIVGLWAVMQSGTHMRAAHDIAGSWEIRPHPDAPSLIPPYKKMTINQSGLFVDLRFQDGPHISGKLERPQHTGMDAIADGLPEFMLAGPDWKLLIVMPVPPFDTLVCNLNGKQSYRFLAQRMINKS